MKSIIKILLASHGTQGAQAAEQATYGMCSKNVHVTHLYVIPEFWKNMMGDDWLNNDITQQRFGNYLEYELSKEVQNTINRVKTNVEDLQASYSASIYIGNPQQCLATTSNKSTFDVIILGSSRPKTISGLRSKMFSTKITKQIKSPVLQIPFPNA